MSTENPISQILEQPKAGISSEDVDTSKANSEVSTKLTQINNVLAVLDLSDKEEDKFRKLLKNKNSETLINLVSKSKKEIIVFLIQNKNTEKNTESLIINQKIQKIKSAFPKSVLNKNPKIADKLNSLD
jgi:hypothetical protein